MSSSNFHSLLIRINYVHSYIHHLNKSNFLNTFIWVWWRRYRFYNYVRLINWSLELWYLKLFASWFNNIRKAFLAQLAIEYFPLNRKSWCCWLSYLLVCKPILEIFKNYYYQVLKQCRWINFIVPEQAHGEIKGLP